MSKRQFLTGGLEFILDDECDPHQIGLGHHIGWGKFEGRVVSYLPVHDFKSASSQKIDFMMANTRFAGFPSSFASPIAPVTFFNRHFLCVEDVGSKLSLDDVLRLKSDSIINNGKICDWFRVVEGRFRRFALELKLSLDLAHRNRFLFASSDLRSIFEKEDAGGSIVLTTCRQFVAVEGLGEEANTFQNKKADVKCFATIILKYLLYPLRLQFVEFNDFYSNGTNLGIYLASVGVPADIVEWLWDLRDLPPLLDHVPFHFLCHAPSLFDNKLRSRVMDQLFDRFYVKPNSRFIDVFNCALLYASNGVIYSERARCHNFFYTYLNTIVAEASTSSRSSKAGKEIPRAFGNKVKHHWDNRISEREKEYLRAVFVDRCMGFPTALVWKALCVAHYCLHLTIYPYNWTGDEQDFIY